MKYDNCFHCGRRKVSGTACSNSRCNASPGYKPLSYGGGNGKKAGNQAVTSNAQGNKFPIKSLIFLLVLFGGTAAFRNEGNAQVDVGNESSPDGNYKFRIGNDTKSSVRVAVHYQNTSGEWLTLYWWEIKPGNKIWLSSGDKLLISSNQHWFFYAESTDGTGVVWEGDYQRNINGEVRGMRKISKTEATSINLHILK